MWRPWTISTSVTMLACLSWLWGACAEEPSPSRAVVHTVTAEQNDHTVKVKPGDELILKLPVQAPFEWDTFGEAAELIRLKVPIKTIPIDPNGPGGSLPKVGGPQLAELHYRVVAQPKGRRFQWVYHSTIGPSGKVVPEPGEPLKPGEIPSKGSVFRVSLVPRD